MNARPCGTVATYVAGCRCADCRAAITAYEKRRRLLHYTDRRPTVPAAPVVRMTRQLMALGWPSAEIARRAGWQNAAAVTNLARKTRVRRETADRVRRVWLDLNGTEGPSEVARQRAAAKGWQRPVNRDDYRGGWVVRGGVWRPTGEVAS